MDFRFRVDPFPGANPNELSTLHLRLTRKGIADLIRELRRIEQQLDRIGPENAGSIEMIGGELYPGTDVVNKIALART